MEIGNLNTQFLNSSIPLSSGGAVNARQNGEESAFKEILKRTQSYQAAGNGNNTPSLSLNKTPIDKTDKLYELCEELETFLIKNLIKGMRSTVQKSKLIDTGFAGEIYEDMLYDEYAKSYAKNANLGFAEMAYRELAKYK